MKLINKFLYLLLLCLAILFIFYFILPEDKVAIQPRLMVLRDNLTLPNGSNTIDLDDPYAVALADDILSRHISSIIIGIKNGSIENNHNTPVG